MKRFLRADSLYQLLQVICLFFFPRRVDIGNDGKVGKLQRINKICFKDACTGIGMRLPHRHDAPAWVAKPGSGKGSFYLAGMMRIVINNGYSMYITDHIKTPAGAAESGKGSSRFLHRKPEAVRGC